MANQKNYLDILNDLTQKKVLDNIGYNVIYSVILNYDQNRNIYREPNKIKLFQNKENKKIMNGLEKMLNGYSIDLELEFTNIKPKFPKEVIAFNSILDGVAFMSIQNANLIEISDFLYNSIIDLRKTSILPGKRTLRQEYLFFLNNFKKKVSKEYGVVFY